MNEHKMKAKLAELQEKEPKLFNELIAAYQEKGNAAFREALPPARSGNASIKRTKHVQRWVWALVEILRERDGGNVVEACKRLDHHGLPDFLQYKTGDNMWRVGREQEPEKFKYAMPDWQGLKGIYYMLERADEYEKGMARCTVRLFIDDEKWQAKYLPPPRVKTQ